MDRRKFCYSMMALPGAMSSASHLALAQTKADAKFITWDSSRQLRFVLNDPLEHPFIWWPRTLLTYPIEFQQPVDLNKLSLTNADTGEHIPFQFTQVVQGSSGIQSATLNFFSDLPSGGHREFVLTPADSPIVIRPQVNEVHDGNTIILVSGVMRVRIPATQTVHGDAPGPILQVSRGEKWFGSSTLKFDGDTVKQITTTRVEHGPIIIAYQIIYETLHGSRYITRIQCNAGMDFVRFQENMEGLKPGLHGSFVADWTQFGMTHRQSQNHPYPVIPELTTYEKYAWERIDDPFFYVLDVDPIPKGHLPFKLGIYQTSTALHTDPSANFWNEHTNDALGVFIDNPNQWQDHEYANHTESETLQVRYLYQDGKFSWMWPLSRGTRSMCITCYDHEKDKQAMHDLDVAGDTVQKDGLKYRVVRAFTSHTMFLQNRHNTIDLNSVKDWVLEYPESAKRPPVIFKMGNYKDPLEMERNIMTSYFIGCLPLLGTRENGGLGSKGIVNFTPVPARQIQGTWVDGFNRLNASMTERTRRRLTAVFLFVAYIHAGDDCMPMVTMLSGHPNFLADVKATPGAMAFLFPDHPMAATWADLWEKNVAVNTRYNTRPTVNTWDASGGRWTENLGTYVWAFMRPSLRTEYLLRRYDGRERYLSPQLAEMANWLVNALTAPFDGESEEAYRNTANVDSGHDWGILAPGKGPRRVHLPQGAHSERRVPPRSLWYFGNCLKQYAPLAAEHAMWAARPTDQDMESGLNRPDTWDVLYKDKKENLGTNPHLRSSKFTGYGLVLRSAVDTLNEVSVHLQQIDQGPNYRWGRSSDGGCGVIYFVAGGKIYSHNGAEDVGDRMNQDTDFCSNFGVYKNGTFRSIGMNVLSRPLYNLGTGQFAEIVSRQGENSYSAPEYLSRSVMLAGHEYFVVYDSLLNQEITHRLTWFVRRGDQLPEITIVRGGNGDPRSTQRTEISTSATTGVWFDGVGDSMAVVSNRKDLDIKPTPFGCQVKSANSDDFVFRNPNPIQYADGDTIFDGTSGLIRTTKEKTDFSLFHGTRIGAAGFIFATDDTDLGIGGSITSGKAISGEYLAPEASSIKITVPSIADKSIFYIDGAAQTARHESDTLVIDLPAGEHHWEITNSLPVPISPTILRTENHAGGAIVFISPIASATQYRLELSKDTGATWSTIATHTQPGINLTGLPNGQKVHVRAVAINAMHESAPGNEYPIYITDKPPLPPDCLHVDLSNGSAKLNWGEVLGVTGYSLYMRPKGAKDFQLLYRGQQRAYVHKHASIRVCNIVPGKPQLGPHIEIFEYKVAAINANGESVMSYSADSDPASWRNWDPMPGEPFRRVSSYGPGSPPSTSSWARYYPD